MTTTTVPGRTRAGARHRTTSRERVTASGARRHADAQRSADRAVRRWLLATALAVAATIGVGGITRLTNSGLSITEWKPVAGILPPSGSAAWETAYQRYLQIPQAQTVHRGISLVAFKRLYWWEWFHRLLARTVGLVIVVPFFVLLLRRKVRLEHHLRLANVPLLTALQGAMGWYMVRSGLTDRTDVSQYRLVAHLALALVILVVAVWTATDLRAPATSEPDDRRARDTRRAATALSVLAFVTLLSGGFVAGLDGGRIFNTFPLMGGHLVPSGYGAVAGWRNAFENPIAAQFHHRLLAVATCGAVLALWAFGERSRVRALLPRLRLVAVMVLAQAGLGIATLLMAVPLPVAVLHQLGGVAVLATLVSIAARRPAAVVPVRGPGLELSA